MVSLVIYLLDLLPMGLPQADYCLDPRAQLLSVSCFHTVRDCVPVMAPLLVS